MSRKHRQDSKKHVREQKQREVREKDGPKRFTFGHCAVCGTPLCTQGGCANTGMCGPCCTGEADTAGEY